MSSKKRKSYIWKHFIADGDGKKASCIHCNRIMAYSGASMSNMNRHLKRQHADAIMDDSQVEIFTVEQVEDASQLKAFEITMKGFDELDSLMKPREKDDNDPDWSPSNEGVKCERTTEAAGSCPVKEKKFRKSVVWDHFEKSPCKTSGQCLHCGKVIKLGTISNLTRHLRLKHPTTPVMLQKLDPPHIVAKIESVDDRECLRRHREEIQTEVVEVNVDDMANPINIIETMTNENRKLFSDPSETEYVNELDYVNASQASQTEFLNEAEEFDINDYIRPKKVAVVGEQVDRQLVKMIVKGCHPVNMVDQPDFRELVSLLNPRYVLPSANKVSLELIPEYYRDCEKRTTKSLRSAEGVVLYIDQWKTKLHNYMCVTAHFVNADCKFESLFLSCHIISASEQSVEISDRLHETVRDWEITDKIVAVVTDNTSPLSDAVKLCNWPHIPHFMRALSLALHMGLQTIKTIIIKVRNLTDELTKVPELLAEVYSTRKMLKLPVVKLIKRVSDDWSSSFMVLEMLTRFEKLKCPIIQVIKNHPEIQPKLSDTEWKSLTSFVEVLSILKTVKREIVQEGRVSMSKIIFYLRTIKTDLKKYQSSNDAMYFATLITTNIEKYFEGFEQIDLIAGAVLLDPCLKKYVFQEESEFASACSKLKKEVCEVVISEPQYPEPSPESFWNSFDTQVRKLNAVQDPIGKGILEFENYLQEPLMNRNENPLVWWSERKAIYPRLFKLVKKYLCLTSTSNPRESISFKSAHMLSHLKFNESSPTESEVMFLHHNM